LNDGARITAMNRKILFVVSLGTLAMIALYFVPPWEAHGEYSGHFRVDRVAWLELDTTRFYLEAGAIAVLTIVVAVMLRNRK
jgi:hypothetical protein